MISFQQLKKHYHKKMGKEILEKLVRKIVKEAPIEYDPDRPERMDPKVEKAISDPKGIYATTRSFRKGVEDVERLTSRRFKEIVDYVRQYYGREENLTDPRVNMELRIEQANAVRQVMMIESSVKNELKDLALEIAAKEEGWLPYSMTFEEALEKGVITKSQVQGGGTRYEFEFIDVIAFLNEKAIDPNQFSMEEKELPKLEIPKDFSFDVDELTPEEKRQLEIEKRHVINALVQGRGKRVQFAYHNFLDRLNSIDRRLAPLYNKIMSLNDLMYFTDQDLIDMLGGNAAGSSEVDSGEEDSENDVIIANGVIFPILLHELGKGFPSVATREQWRGMEPGMAMDIMGKTDVFTNEPMQFRVGAELLRKLRTLLPEDLQFYNLENKIYIPYFERRLYGIPADVFLKEIIANVISENESDNDKARRHFEQIYSQAKKDYEKAKSNEDEDEEDDDLLFR